MSKSKITTRCNFNSTLIGPWSGRLQGWVHTTAERGRKLPLAPKHAKSILRIPWSPALHLITYHLSPTPRLRHPP